MKVGALWLRQDKTWLGITSGAIYASHRTAHHADPYSEREEPRDPNGFSVYTLRCASPYRSRIYDYVSELSLHCPELFERPNSIPIIVLGRNLSSSEGQNRNTFDCRLFTFCRNAKELSHMLGMPCPFDSPSTGITDIAIKCKSVFSCFRQRIPGKVFCQLGFAITR